MSEGVKVADFVAGATTRGSSSHEGYEDIPCFNWDGFEFDWDEFPELKRLHEERSKQRKDAASTTTADADRKEQRNAIISRWNAMAGTKDMQMLKIDLDADEKGFTYAVFQSTAPSTFWDRGRNNTRITGTHAFEWEFCQHFYRAIDGLNRYREETQAIFDRSYDEILECDPKDDIEVVAVKCHKNGPADPSFDDLASEYEFRCVNDILMLVASGFKKVRGAEKPSKETLDQRERILNEAIGAIKVVHEDLCKDCNGIIAIDHYDALDRHSLARRVILECLCIFVRDKLTRRFEHLLEATKKEKGEGPEKAKGRARPKKDGDTDNVVRRSSNRQRNAGKSGVSTNEQSTDQTQVHEREIPLPSRDTALPSIEVGSSKAVSSSETRGSSGNKQAEK